MTESNYVTPYRIRDSIHAYLAPILIAVVGALAWGQWTAVQNQMGLERETTQKITVQLATIQEQIAEIQRSYSTEHESIVDMEQRVRVLERK